jgi:hypothetical protein
MRSKNFLNLLQNFHTPFTGGQNLHRQKKILCVDFYSAGAVVAAVFFLWLVHCVGIVTPPGIYQLVIGLSAMRCML